MAIPTTSTQQLGDAMRSVFETVCAEALFVSSLQSSDRPSPDQVRRAVTAALRQLGINGCAAQLAGEFGDHPDTAAARMTWALVTIRDTYVARPAPPTRTLRPLSLAM
jgi:hypothetical protein